MCFLGPLAGLLLTGVPLAVLASGCGGSGEHHARAGRLTSPVELPGARVAGDAGRPTGALYGMRPPVAGHARGRVFQDPGGLPRLTPAVDCGDTCPGPLRRSLRGGCRPALPPRLLRRRRPDVARAVGASRRMPDHRTRRGDGRSRVVAFRRRRERSQIHGYTRARGTQLVAPARRAAPAASSSWISCSSARFAGSAPPARRTLGDRRDGSCAATDRGVEQTVLYCNPPSRALDVEVDQGGSV